MNASILSVVLISALPVAVLGHSWAACVDYDAEVTSNNYDEDQCHGFAPDYYGDEWRDSNGYAYRPYRNVENDLPAGTVPDACQPRDLSDYSDEFPMAHYTVGDTVRILWPARNHVDNDCSPKNNIPQTAMRLYVTCDASPPRDIDSFLSQATLVQDWGQRGFENCPFYCDDVAYAVCYGDFVVPELPVQDGETCLFMWYWHFDRVYRNYPHIYTTCYEAAIHGSSAPAETVPQVTQAPAEPEPEPQVTQAPVEPEPEPEPEPAQDSGCSSSRVWEQCGGNNYNGETCCGTDSFFGATECVFNNEWYSQCIPLSYRTSNRESETAEDDGMTVPAWTLGVGVGMAFLIVGAVAIQRKMKSGKDDEFFRRHSTELVGGRINL